MIDGTTRILGIVGFPLDHSLSPVFQNYILAESKLKYRYVPFPVDDPESLPAVFSGLAAAGVRGVNVTVPHKVAAAKLCHELSEEARLAGAVNTIVFGEDGRLSGHNTDVAGFLAPLEGVALAGRDALVLGAGGAARAVALGLARMGALVTLTSRTRAHADDVAGAIETHTAGHLAVLPWEDRHGAVARSALVVNATPLGQHPQPDGCPLDEGTVARPGQVWYDLVYNPLRTRFLRMGEAGGARTVDGLSMLIAQGVAALELWLGRAVDPRVAAGAHRVAAQELERRRGEGRTGL